MSDVQLPYSIALWRKRAGVLWFWEVWREADDKIVAKALRGLDSVEDAQTEARRYCAEHQLSATVDHPTII